MLICTLEAVACHRADRPSGLANVLAEAGLATAPEGVSALLTRALRGTRWESRWTLNGAHDRTVLGVLFLGPDTRWWVIDEQLGAAEAFRGNCRWLADDRLVVCDTTLLTDDLSTRTRYPAQAGERSVFMEWVVLHEVGHAVLGHGDGRVTAPLELAQEYAADCWSLDTLGRIGGTRWPDMVALSSNLIGGWMSRRATRPLPAGAGVIYDYNAVEPVLVAHGVQHPHHLMRAARMLQLAGAAGGDPGVRAMADAFRSRLARDPLAVPECSALIRSWSQGGGDVR